MQIEILREEDIEKIDSLIETYRYDKYIKVNLFNTIKAKKYLSDKIKEFYNKNTKTVIAAKENEELLGILCYRKIEWDTKHFGFNVGRIEYFLTGEMPYKKEVGIKTSLMKEFEEWCRKENIKFVSTKIDSSDYSTLHTLENFDFRYMATVITPMLDCRNLKDDFKSDIKLRNLKDNEIDVIVKMAENIFKINRFHLDENFDKEKADKLHGDWVRNRYKENPENVYVLDHNGDIIGFFAVLIEDLSKYFGLKTSYLELAGISDKYRGKGYDLILFRSMINILKDKVEIIDTDFIVENTPIFNIYAKLGFKFVNSKITMHKWF